MFFNSSWVLFSAEDAEVGGNMSDNDSDNGGNLSGKFKPYRFSGKNHSFDPVLEKPILREIRSWTNEYMSSNSVIHKSSYTSLKEAHTVHSKEIDLLVKIIKVFERDEFNWEVRIKDLSQESWTLTVNKLKF